MKKILKYSLFIPLLLFALLMSGCRSYDAPTPDRESIDSDFPEGFITIAEVKQLYTDVHGSAYSGAVVIDDDIVKGRVIRAKVISDDEGGNVYREMYVQDETGGIAIKVGTTGNYNVYKPGQRVYVHITGDKRDKVMKSYKYVLGRYRFSLSIGAPVSPTSEYVNAYIDDKHAVAKTVKRGAPGSILDSRDTTVIKSPADLHDGLLGSLIRVENATSFWGAWDGNSYPSFLEQKTLMNGTIAYQDYLFETVIRDWNQYLDDLDNWSGDPATEPVKPTSPRPGNLDVPTYAFKNTATNASYYGSTIIRLGTSPTDPTHNLILRCSGFSKFALDAIPSNGARVTVTAIYNKYSSSSGGFIKYQLLINDSKDVKILR